MTREYMDERSRQVLCAIVESFIGKPEPVGSRLVTKKYSIGFSSATIRNIMADLEDEGLISQPYTSAGRIPTDMGYRFYVDSIFDREQNRLFAADYKKGVDVQQYYDETLGELICKFAKELAKIKNDMNSMFFETTNLLASMSNYIGVAIPPRPEEITFKRLDLIRYKEDCAVAVLQTDEGVVKSRIVKLDLGQNQNDLNRIAAYLNSEFSGLAVSEIKETLLKKFKQEKAAWDKLITRAIRICEQTINFSSEDIFVSGLYDVMNLPDFTDISRMREMARTIKDKHLILQLLSALLHSEGVKVMIGKENSMEEFKNVSIVASTYKDKDKPMGIIALIGPTRMDYSKAIYVVDKLATCISRALD
ncbi:MAG: heat-inducible transcriptional repressor HrcA [Nitrospirae bacterium]|nr:heat-inducible transcriptional repressor HrcA [Nitrospirota bacterium]